MVPLFNEEQAVGEFYRVVRQESTLHGHTVQMVLINDGSTDRTAEYAGAIALADSNVVLINFSRNFGKEAALFAGLEYATGDAVIPIDADLQDPVEVIPQLVAEWQKALMWCWPNVAIASATATSSATARRCSITCSTASPTPTSKKTSATSG